MEPQTSGHHPQGRDQDERNVHHPVDGGARPAGPPATERSNLSEAQLSARRDSERTRQAESRLRMTEEQRAAARERDRIAHQERRANLTDEQRERIRTQHAANQRAVRHESYSARDFEERFEVDPEAALQKFCTMSGLQHQYNVAWAPAKFEADIEGQLRDSAATKERLAKEWDKAMVRTTDQPIRGCASCGRAKRTTYERSIDSLWIFLLVHACSRRVASSRDMSCARLTSRFRIPSETDCFVRAGARTVPTTLEPLLPFT